MLISRHIAIDNVCGWPNLTQLPDGTLIATIFNQPCHGFWEGDVECWASTDGGQFWTYRGTPAPHEPGTVRMNVAAGLAGNGDLVVLASGWGNHMMSREDYEQAAAQPGYQLDRGDILRNWICRSSDAGQTWQIDKDTFPTGVRNQYIPFGDILIGRDNQLHACAYQRVPDQSGQPPRHRADMLTSSDNGRTWKLSGIIHEHDQNETTPLHLGDGQWIVASRTQTTGQLNQFRSMDDGQSWQYDQMLSLPRQHPAHYCRLNNDSLLLTYSVRTHGAMGIYFRTSADDAHTWTAPIALVTYPDCDHGYPSTVQNADGTLTTLWYCAHLPCHTRYHVAAARWKLP